VLLIPPLMSLFGLGGIALAAALAKALKVLALLLLFGRRVPAFHLAMLGPFAGKMALASLATAAALAAMQTLGSGLEARGLLMLAVYLALAGGLGGGVFFSVTYLLQVEELQTLWQRARAWLRR